MMIALWLKLLRSVCYECDMVQAFDTVELLMRVLHSHLRIAPT